MPTGDEAADLVAFAAWEQAAERHYHPERFGPGGARPPVPREFTYYLGVPEPSWLNKLDVGPNGAYLGSGIPKFVSAARFARYRSGPERWPVVPTCTYAIDSGAYIALNSGNTNVPWYASPDVYGDMILRFITNNGYPPDFCAPQDWPCEPHVLKITGLTEREHQQFTLDSYRWLSREFPMVPWIPVLQGEHAGGHLEHAKMYADVGVDLSAAHRVGIGSICRLDQLGDVVARIDAFEELAAAGLKLHGFGIKTSALPLIGHLLRSADSMAWSFNARHSNIRLPGCGHAGDCRNCYRYAVRWRERVLASLPISEEVPISTATRPHPSALLCPAGLRIGDVFVHPERGRLTLVKYDVASSARPTVARLTVKEGKPVEIDAFDGSTVEVVSRGSVDPLFACSRKGTAHLFVPLTDAHTRCGECGDTHTPNHIPMVEPGSDVPIDLGSLLGAEPEPAAVNVPPGATIQCSGRGCGRQAKIRRDGKIGAHKRFGRDTCPLTGELPPPGVKVLRMPAATTELFAGMADFAALVADAMGLSGPGPLVIPLAEAEWGMYGRVKGYGPTGDRCTETGYITKPPRVTTRGFSSTARRKSDPLLTFSIDKPSDIGSSGTSTRGMFAEPDAVFTVLDPPADQPLLKKKHLGFRAPIADLRRGDVFYIWDEPGQNHDERGDLRPRYHVQSDPSPIGDGQYDLVVLVHGEVATRHMDGDTWADVENPQKTPWQQAGTSLAEVPVGAYIEINGIGFDGQPRTTRGYVLRADARWSCQRPGMPVVDLSPVWPPRTPHGSVIPVQVEPGCKVAVLDPPKSAPEPPTTVTGDEPDVVGGPVGTTGDGLDDVRAVLARSTLHGATLGLPSETLPRTAWETLHAMLLGMGARGGSRKGQPYIFETDRRDELDLFIAGGPAPKHERTTAGWVRTPGALAADVVARFAELHTLRRPPRVLEPSAGDGSLIRAVLTARPNAKVTAVELVEERAFAAGKIAGVSRVHVGPFEDFADRFHRDAQAERFDLIVMNPPYSVPRNRTVWASHVRLAWEMLAEGGRLVAILPGLLDQRSDRTATELLALLGPDVHVEELPERSFREYGTDFSTCVVAATKLASGVQAARILHAASQYRPAPGEPVRVASVELTAAAVIARPVQVFAGFGGETVVRYVGTCIGCGALTWSDGNNDPRGALGLAAVQPLTAETYCLDGPDLCRCWACADDGRRRRALKRAETLWTKPQDEAEASPLFDLNALDIAVTAALVHA